MMLAESSVIRYQHFNDWMRKIGKFENGASFANQAVINGMEGCGRYTCNTQLRCCWRGGGSNLNENERGILTVGREVKTFQLALTEENGTTSTSNPIIS